MTPPARPLGGGLTDSRVIRRASLSADAPAVAVSWPLTVPAVAALRDGLELGPGVTFLVGENGTGKSTVLGYFSYLGGMPGSPDGDLHEMSHGESFLALLDRKIDSPGFFCLDEPEAALSFQSTLRYLGRLDELAKAGAQIVCATHSPVLASLPGARVLEFGEWGIREAAWEELELVAHWRNYLQAPGRYLRHLLD
ncbi:AAA family ATPase [Herbiconiux sp. VKM Ac-1786]|uniref:AAA family ATPase n=1 Tax=Herbiconiux sp. VKM Ac-1786 TaxID=2783824 RepID=UPI00188D478C|nr:AAA family ATPase [Herbiconiux sp. VKM Ac-1786]MBF4570980.1 AAA family ATPase [Herbiconiux sp. VKM Ac-1786]